jgi:hypothetical protein
MAADRKIVMDKLVYEFHRQFNHQRMAGFRMLGKSDKLANDYTDSPQSVEAEPGI